MAASRTKSQEHTPRHCKLSKQLPLNQEFTMGINQALRKLIFSKKSKQNSKQISKQKKVQKRWA